MFEIFGISSQALFSLLLLGAINGSFYAIRWLGAHLRMLQHHQLHARRPVHDGRLRRMDAAMPRELLLHSFSRRSSAFSGLVLERCSCDTSIISITLRISLQIGFFQLIRSDLMVDHVHVRLQIPDSLSGGTNLGFMFLPNYRIWVISASLGVCLAIWYVIERTRLGSYLRAGTENPVLVQAFGINIRRMITLTYMLGVGLAAFAGVLAAPIIRSAPSWARIYPDYLRRRGDRRHGSIMGSIVTGFVLGLIEASPASSIRGFRRRDFVVVMVAILLIRPQACSACGAETVSVWSASPC